MLIDILRALLIVGTATAGALTLFICHALIARKDAKYREQRERKNQP